MKGIKISNNKLNNKNVDYPFKSPVILSYCTGFRGLERGIERAIGATRTAVYVEIEAFIIENLLAGMEQGILDAAPIWPNIKTFDAQPFRDRIHGIIGGYPCQPFSMAGSRKGTDDPRHLWPYLERDIRAVRPVWCFFENVSGHLSLGFQEVRQSLSDLGYAVEPGMFTAAEVGAPHQRKRLFILAIIRDYLGNAKQNGFDATSKLRWSDETSNGSTERQIAPSEFKGTDRPDSDGSLSGSELGNTHSDGNPEGLGAGGYSETTIGDKKNYQQRQRIWAKPASAGENELAKTCNIGCEHRRNNWQKRHIQRNIRTSKENKSEWKRWKRWERGACKACTNLARRKKRKLEHSDLSVFGKTRRKSGQVLQEVANHSNSGSTNVANTNCSGGGQNTQSSQLWASSFEQPPLNSRITPKRENNERRLDRWPARPGQPQYDWEEPRTEGYTNRLPGSIRQLWHLCRKDFEKVMGEKVWTETDRNIKANVESRVGSTIDGYNFREDLLRAYGNSVVEQTAELAMRTLLKKFGL